MAKPPVNWNNVSMLTPGLKNLGNQFNERWPTRYGDSDGAVGDYAHSEYDSGHNADDTKYNNAEWDSDSDNKSEVRAIDVDCDLNDPSITSSSDKQAQMQKVIDHMRNLPDLSSVIRYMIFDGRIYKASNGFKAETYTGSSAHTEHAHFSGAYSQSSDENTSFDYRFEEVGDMALSDADINKIVDKVWGKTFDNPYTTEVEGTWAGGYLRYAPSLSRIRNELMPQFDQLDASNAALSTEVTELKAMVAELTALVEGHVSGIIEANR